MISKISFGALTGSQPYVKNLVYDKGRDNGHGVVDKMRFLHAVTYAEINPKYDVYVGPTGKLRLIDKMGRGAKEQPLGFPKVANNLNDVSEALEYARHMLHPDFPLKSGRIALYENLHARIMGAISNLSA